MTDSEEEDDYQNVVIDPGSYCIKAGFSGDDSPRAIFASCTGRPVHKGVCHYSMAPPDTYIGDEAIAKQGILKLNWPIHERSIRHFFDFQKILDHTFYNELRIEPEEHKIFIAETPNTSQTQREKICEIIFENYETNYYYYSNQQVLALYANEQTNGIVLDIGYNSTFCVPIYEGYVFKKGILHTNYGGEQISSCLQKLLKDQKLWEYEFRRTLSDIKTKILYCNKFTFEEYNSLIIGFLKYKRNMIPDVIKDLCLNYYGEFESNMEYEYYSYDLPDMQKINVNIKQRINPVEMLFDPNLFENTDFYENKLRSKYFARDGIVNRGCYDHPYSMGKYEIDKISIQQLLNQCIEICANSDLKNDITQQNVYLCGGSAMFDGMKERLQREVDRNNDTNVVMNVIAPKMKYMTWIGGSILCSISGFNEQWLTREQYNETGVGVVSRIE